MDWQKVTPELRKKLDPAAVKPPPQGKHGEYVDGYHVISEANRIFGEENWSYQITRLEKVSEQTVRLEGRNGPYEQYRVGYLCTVKVVVNGTSFKEGSAVGTGVGSPQNIADHHESAVKEAETDALKRALRTYGNTFGLALYDKARANVGVDAPPFDPAACDERLRAGMDKLTNKAEATEWWQRETPALLALKEADLARYEKLRADLAAKKLPEKAPAPSTDMIPGAFQEA